MVQLANGVVYGTFGGAILNLIGQANPPTIPSNIAAQFPEATGLTVNTLIATGLNLLLFGGMAIGQAPAHEALIRIPVVLEVQRDRTGHALAEARGERPQEALDRGEVGRDPVALPLLVRLNH